MLTSGPILRTLLRLAAPNVLAMFAAAAVGIAETSYVGLLGKEPLAAMALVFPMVMLMQMLSAGAMGGSISSSIARALGAGQLQRAQALAFHSVVIGLVAGGVSTVLLLVFGHALYYVLGGRDHVLSLALGYSNTLFAAAVLMWLVNTLVSVLRGTGDMRVPSITILAMCLLQIALGAGLAFGLGPLPRLEMQGVALGQVIALACACAYLLAILFRGSSARKLRLTISPLRRDLFIDILRVGAVACLSPLQTVLTVLIFTGFVARFGVDALAGFGIGARLEFLLIPIAFGVGVAAVPMVGMAMGRGDVARARRVAWTAGATSFVLLSVIGFIVSLVPDLWAAQFSSDLGVLAAARQYLQWVGPCFGLFGLGLTLYFASQGAGKVLGPVLAVTLRLLIIGIGGTLLAVNQSSLGALYALAAIAMASYGCAAALAVKLTPWTGRKTAPPSGPLPKD